MDNIKVRQATHANSWYSGDKKELDEELNSYLSKAKKENIQNIKAIIGPHAGYAYSGPTAGWAYQYLNEQKKRVFLLGPCHKLYLRTVGLSKLDQYATPLGNITLDQEVIQKLAQELGKLAVFTKQADEEDEHSLELHLPFIYKAFPNAKLVPIMVGSTDPQLEEKVAQVLVQYFDNPENIFVISSDFCHWGKRFGYTPYDKDKNLQIHEQIQNMDQEGVKLIENHNIADFYKYLETTDNTICGRHPICVLLQILQKTTLKLTTKLVKYAQSNAVTNPKDSSVSYASIVTYIQ